MSGEEQRRRAMNGPPAAGGSGVAPLTRRLTAGIATISLATPDVTVYSTGTRRRDPDRAHQSALVARLRAGNPLLSDRIQALREAVDVVEEDENLVELFGEPLYWLVDLVTAAAAAETPAELSAPVYFGFLRRYISFRMASEGDLTPYTRHQVQQCILRWMGVESDAKILAKEQISTWRMLTNDGMNIAGLELNLLSSILPLVPTVAHEELGPLLAFVASVVEHHHAILPEPHLHALLQTLAKLSSTETERSNTVLRIADLLLEGNRLARDCLESVLLSIFACMESTLFLEDCQRIFRSLLLSHHGLVALQWTCKLLADVDTKAELAVLALSLLEHAFWSPEKVSDTVAGMQCTLEAVLERLDKSNDEDAFSIPLLSGLSRMWSSPLNQECSQRQVEISIDIFQHLVHAYRERHQEDISWLDSLRILSDQLHFLVLRFPIHLLHQRFYVLLLSAVTILEEPLALRTMEFLVGEALPPSDDTLKQLGILGKLFFVDTTRSTAVRLRFLHLLDEYFETVGGCYNDRFFADILAPLLHTIHLESDPAIAIRCVRLLVSGILHGEPETTASLLGRLFRCARESVCAPGRIESAIAICLLFEVALISKEIAVHVHRLYAFLLELVAFALAETEIRILCARQLMRIRCTNDAARRIYLAELDETLPNPIGTGRLREYFGKFLPSDANVVSPFVRSFSKTLPESTNALESDRLLHLVTDRLLTNETEWRLVECAARLQAVQLRNRALFEENISSLQELRSLVCDCIFNDRLADFAKHLVPARRGEVYLVLFEYLQSLLTYRFLFTKQQHDELVQTYQVGLQKWNSTAVPCIHGLSICALEIALSTAKYLPNILLRFTQILSGPSLSIHILEFLSIIARQPSLYKDFIDDDFKRVFGIAIQYIQSHQRFLETGPQTHSALTFSQYVLNMAYHVVATWYSKLKSVERKRLAPFLLKALLSPFRTSRREDQPLEELLMLVDEKTEVCLDWIYWFLLQDWIGSSSLISSTPKPASSRTRSWLIGRAVLTLWYLDHGAVRATIKRAVGTIELTIDSQSSTVDMKSVCLALLSPLSVSEDEKKATVSVEKELLSIENADKLITHFIPHLQAASIVPLAEDPAMSRALSVLDRTPIIDLHKIGVVYVAPGQSKEDEILANTRGSQEYLHFLQALGDWIRLKGCKDIYTGALDTENDLDGKYACYWKDDVAQVIFHCSTLMPTNLELDPHSNAKKRHIGNDYVTIVFDDSGTNEYAFDTIPSQFNFVNILIRHVRHSSSQQYGSIGGELYEISMQKRADMPDLGPLAEPKVVSNVGHVAAYIRQVAVHANIFAQIFQQLLPPQRPIASGSMAPTPSVSRQTSAIAFPNRQSSTGAQRSLIGLGTSTASYASTGSTAVTPSTDSEYVSNVRERLRQLKRIQERATASQ